MSFLALLRTSDVCDCESIVATLAEFVFYYEFHVFIFDILDFEGCLRCHWLAHHVGICEQDAEFI